MNQDVLFMRNFILCKICRYENHNFLHMQSCFYNYKQNRFLTGKLYSDINEIKKIYFFYIF